MRLELFDVSRRWPRQRTQSDDEGSFVNSGIFLLLLFNSSALYYLQTPTRRYGHASTPPQFLPISGDRDVLLPLSLEWPVWSSSNGNNCHAVHKVTLFRCITLKWDLHLVPYYQPSSPARFLSIIGHWDVSLPLSSEWQEWSSSSGNNYHAVHRSLSSGASHFFYGTVRDFFTLSHIVSQAVFYNWNSNSLTTMSQFRRLTSSQRGLFPEALKVNNNIYWVLSLGLENYAFKTIYLLNPNLK